MSLFIVTRGCKGKWALLFTRKEIEQRHVINYFDYKNGVRGDEKTDRKSQRLVTIIGALHGRQLYLLI